MSALLNALRRNAAHHADRVAVVGSYNLTWAQLQHEVYAAQSLFAGRRRVALLLDNSPAWVVADLALLLARITQLPLAPFFSSAQIRYALQDAAVDTILTDRPDEIDTANRIVARHAVTLAGVPLTLLHIAAEQDTSVPATVAKLTYTSGTTGTPKAVQLSLRAMEQVAMSLVAACHGSSDDRALATLPLSILLENIGSLYAPILAGAQIIVPASEVLGVNGSSHVDAIPFARALHAYRPTTLILPPELLKLLVALGWEQTLPDSFRFIAVGGASTGSQLLTNAQELGLPVYQGYGLSEACSVVTLNTPGGNRAGSVGRPLAHSRVTIDDDAHVHVGGALADGYLHGDAFSGATLDTGDLGYLDDDGYLYISGRHCNRIITGYGRNISPEWVESELSAHPAICRAVVTQGAAGGLQAVLIPGAGVSNEQLRAGVSAGNARLPDYARVTRYAAAEQGFSYARGELTSTGAPQRDIITNNFLALTETEA